MRERAECPTQRATTFSVVIPAYNATATLSETLESVATQQFSDWECIVVDDGSTDDTAQIAFEYRQQDSRFVLVRQDNAGTAGAYRTAVQNASADLLVICAADDLLLPRHLSEMHVLITENPDYQIYSCNGEYLLQATRDRGPIYSSDEWSAVRSLSFEEVIAKCFYSVGTVIRRSAYDIAGGHRVGVYTDDYDLWLRAMARGARHLYTPEILSVHRVSDFQQSANLVRLYESNIEVYESLLSTEPLNDVCRSAVEMAIERTRDEIRLFVAARQLEDQALALRSRVQKIVGPRYVESVMRAIHSVSWVTRPFREWIAERRSMKM